MIPPRVKEAGFSLLELMVVVAIAGTLLYLYLRPSSSLPEKVRFESFKADFRGILETARNWARTRQECVTVSVAVAGANSTVTAQGYSVSTQPCPTNFAAIPTDPNSFQTLLVPTGTTLSAFTLPTGAAVAPLVFNSAGGMDYGANVAVTTGFDNYTTKMQINFLTGQVTQ